MPSSESVRVQLSSEVAESISITPVCAARQHSHPRSGSSTFLGLRAGCASAAELLLLGTLGQRRFAFRWAGWDADRDRFQSLWLLPFPIPIRSGHLRKSGSFRAALARSRRRIEIPREIGRGKPLFRRASFWDTLNGSGCLRAERGMWTIRTANARLLQRRAFACRFGTAAGQRETGKYTTLQHRFRHTKFQSAFVAL